MTQSIAARLASIRAAIQAIGTDVGNLQQQSRAWKIPARVASTANVTIASPGDTIDGVTLASGDRVLLKNQTAGAENGIYAWTGATTAMTRTSDADAVAELLVAIVLVTQGTVNRDTIWQQTADAITLGTTAITWASFGGGGPAYSAGDGLTLAGTTFNVGAGVGIVVDADLVRIDPAVVVRKFAATIGDGTATSIAVNHNLGTKDLTYSIQEVSTGAFVDTDAVASSTTTLTLTFAAAPTAGQYRVVVHA